MGGRSWWGVGGVGCALWTIFHHSHTLSLSSQISHNYALLTCWSGRPQYESCGQTHIHQRHYETWPSNTGNHTTINSAYKNLRPLVRRARHTWTAEVSRVHSLHVPLYCTTVCTIDVKVTEFRGEGSGTHGIHHQVTRGGEHIPCLCCPARLSNTATFCKTSQVEDVVSILQLRWRVPLLLKTLVLKQINPTHPSPHPSLPWSVNHIKYQK